MSETTKRIISGVIMALVAIAAGVMQYFGIPAVKYLGIIIALMMIVEMALCIRRASGDARHKNRTALTLFTALLVLVLVSVTLVGSRPWIMLLLLMTIAAADIGAWFFGRILGGDKIWERLSPSKTWSGQIAGILCGTFAAILYGLLGTDTFMPQLMWIGISVSLLSQYGDLTASFIKRRLGIKDFGHILPGHGGMLDRFDGWIYVLPIIWLVML